MFILERIRGASLAGTVLLLVFAGSMPRDSRGEEFRPETLFPDHTRGFFAISNLPEFREHVKKTQLGQLLQDPALEPFVQDLRAQVESRFDGVRGRLGIPLDELGSIVTGGLGIAVLYSDSDAQAGLAAVLEIEGKRPEAQQALDRVAENARQGGGSVTTEPIGGKEVTIITLPEDERRGLRRMVYYLDDQRLVAADSTATIEGVLTRMGGDSAATLAEQKAFARIMERCGEDAQGAAPQIRWFIEPFGYTAAVRSAIPPERRRRERRLAEALKAAGFSALQGIGGFVDAAVEPYEVIHRTFVYAPGPLEKSAKIFSFPNSKEFAPPAFVPRDLATYAAGYCDILNAFDNVGPVFDQTIGEGEEGVWQDVLDSLKNDPAGPQFDLRNEFFVHFGRRIVVFTQYELPITPNSERMLVALEVKDQDAAAQALDKMFQHEARFERREHNGRVIWEGLPEEKKELPDLNLEGIPGVGEIDGPAEEESAPIFPNASLTVYDGYLLIASHYDYLLAILDGDQARQSLERNPDYLIVMEQIDKLGGEEACLKSFSLTEEQYRPTYELIRQGKMPESQTLMGRVLNSFLAPEPGKPREQRIDGGKLPDYEVVRRHLGPAGLFGKAEKDGWFLKGFTLPKE
ncbi:MAG: hypothetical protein GYA33_00135 [Thermogutta sp.]|nr:hypothetical protein [Thermogutta sp.]